jgi:hypothetical protein
VDLQAYAQGMVAASNAKAVATYWIATRDNQPAGLGRPGERVIADGRYYRLADGALLALQDERGLISVNLPDRQALQQLLIQDGVAVERTDAFIDTLLDYAETSPFKRLNGADAAAYAALGLPPPRHDWLRSLGELSAMPYWSEDPNRLARLSRSLSVRRSDWINPYSAPESVLKAFFPAARPEQLRNLLALREQPLQPPPTALQAATGLDFSREAFLPHVGTELGLTIWAPGLPRALHYNLLIVPGGIDGPWLVTGQQSKNRPTLPDDTHDIPAFPMGLDGAERHPPLAEAGTRQDRSP